jgi:hypothetical protein
MASTDRPAPASPHFMRALTSDWPRTEDKVFQCTRWPSCGCPDGAVASDCPGLTLDPKRVQPTGQPHPTTEEQAMRHHSAALSLDQALQDLDEAHALLRQADRVISSMDWSRLVQESEPLYRDLQCLVSTIRAHLPPPKDPPAEGSSWRLSPTAQPITVLGCVRAVDPLVVYQYDGLTNARQTSVMDLHEFLQIARPAT